MVADIVEGERDEGEAEEIVEPEALALWPEEQAIRRPIAHPGGRMCLWDNGAEGLLKRMLPGCRLVARGQQRPCVCRRPAMRRGVPYKLENNVPHRPLHRIAHHHGAAVAVGDAAGNVGGNRAPLLLVALKESGTGASLEHPGDLPGEVARVLNTGVQAEPPN